MKISLVTTGLPSRYRRRFLDSLVAQEYRNFEMLLLEPGEPGPAIGLLESYPDLDTRVLTADHDVTPSRNVGLKDIGGDVVGFPSDACWYTPGTLQRVSHLFQADPTLAVACGRVIAPSGPMLQYPRRATEVTDRTVWRTVAFPGLFVRKEALELVGRFDETVGVPGAASATS